MRDRLRWGGSFALSRIWRRGSFLHDGIRKHGDHAGCRGWPALATSFTAELDARVASVFDSHQHQSALEVGKKIEGFSMHTIEFFFQEPGPAALTLITGREERDSVRIGF